MKQNLKEKLNRMEMNLIMKNIYGEKNFNNN